MSSYVGRILVAVTGSLVAVGCMLLPPAQASTQSTTTSDVGDAVVVLDEPTSELGEFSPAQLSALLDVSQDQLLAELGVTSDSSALPIGTISDLIGVSEEQLIAQLPLDQIASMDLGALAYAFEVSPSEVALSVGVTPSELGELDPSLVDLEQLLQLLNLDPAELLSLLETTTNSVADRLSAIDLPEGTVLGQVSSENVRVVFVPTPGSNNAGARKALAVSTRSLRRVRAGKRFMLEVRSSHAGVARVSGKRVRRVSKKVGVGTTKIRLRAPKRAGMHVLKVRVSSSDGQSQTKSVVLKVKRSRR